MNTESGRSLQWLCHLRGFHRITEEATHRTMDARMSGNGKLQINFENADDLATAVGKDLSPNIGEVITDRFKMFVEFRGLQGTELLDLKEVELLVGTIGRCFARFFETPEPCEKAFVLCPDAFQGADTCIRVVFPGMVVDTGEALRMHALLISHLEHMQDSPKVVVDGVEKDGEINIRRKLLPHEFALETQRARGQKVAYAPPMQKWSKVTCNSVYLKEDHLQMVLTMAYIQCPEAGPHTRCPSCMGSKCIAKPNTQLKLACILNGLDGKATAQQSEEKKALIANPEKLVKEAMLRTMENVTPWNAPIGCPFVPQKTTATGMRVMEAYTEERAALRPSEKKHLVDDHATTKLIENDVRHLHARYGNLYVVNMIRTGNMNGAHTYRVNVGGEGSHFCQNIGGDHNDAHIYFEISSSGYRQKCNCRSSNAAVACTMYKPRPRPMTPETRSALGYYLRTQTGGDFWHQLVNKYIPELALRKEGKKPIRPSGFKKRR